MMTHRCLGKSSAIVLVVGVVMVFGSWNLDLKLGIWPEASIYHASLSLWSENLDRGQRAEFNHSLVRLVAQTHILCNKNGDRAQTLARSRNRLLAQPIIDHVLPTNNYNLQNAYQSTFFFCFVLIKPQEFLLNFLPNLFRNETMAFLTLENLFYYEVI